jgi:hypothetical protein
VLSGSAPEGERPAPEELMPRHLAPPDTVPLEGSRLLVLHGQEPSTLEVWVRNNSLRELSGRVTLVAPDGAGVGPAAAQEFRISAGQPLGKVTFKISAGAGLPRGRHELKLRAAGSDGRTREQRLILLRPLAWLVSSRLSLHGDGSGRPHAAAGAVESAPGGAFPGNVKGLTWTALREDCVTPFGLVDMRAAAGDAEDVMAYAYTEVTSPRETACLLEVMHDDMIRVWLNGRQVFREDYELIPATLTRKLVKVKLPAGRSRVLVKTGQRREHWEFAVGFLEEKGSDPLAVKVSDTFSSPVRGEETAGLSR